MSFNIFDHTLNIAKCPPAPMISRIRVSKLVIDDEIMATPSSFQFLRLSGETSITFSYEEGRRTFDLDATPLTAFRIKDNEQQTVIMQFREQHPNQTKVIISFNDEIDKFKWFAQGEIVLRNFLLKDAFKNPQKRPLAESTSDAAPPTSKKKRCKKEPVNLSTLGPVLANTFAVLPHEKWKDHARSVIKKPLTEEEQLAAKEAIKRDPTAIVAKIGTDTVDGQRMASLAPRKWLNDEIIHYFFKLLNLRDENMYQSGYVNKRCHFFKSFFVTKMNNEGNADPKLEGQYLYDNVKRWSKNVPYCDIFKLDKIIIPINQRRLHWMCAVIDMRKKQIVMYDSMHGGGEHYLQSLFKYLKNEHMEKKKTPLTDMDSWKLINFVKGTPYQRNGKSITFLFVLM